MLFFLPPAHAGRSLLQQLGPCKPGCTPAHISASDPPPGWILPLYRLKSGTSSGISLATSGAQHVSVRATAEQWNYAISSCKKKKAGLDLDGMKLWVFLPFLFFFSLSCVEWKLGFWNSSATTKEKHTAAGWVVSWPSCTLVADFVRASKPVWHRPCPYSQLQSQQLQKLPLFFSRETDVFSGMSALSSALMGKIHISCWRLLWQGTGREAGAVLVYLLLWFYFEVHTC